MSVKMKTFLLPLFAIFFSTSSLFATAPETSSNTLPDGIEHLRTLMASRNTVSAATAYVSSSTRMKAYL